MTCAPLFAVRGGFVAPWEVSIHDWMLITLLAVACTLLPWLWSLRILKTLSPYTVAISVSLEPAYSIAIAYALWPKEEGLHPRFYAGVALLVGLVLANGLLKRRAA